MILPALRHYKGLATVGSMALLSLAVACNKEGSAHAAPPPMAVPMQVAEPTAVNTASEYLATLKSRNTTSVNPLVEGQITQIYVKSGERVQAGALLMQIDPLKQQATTGSQEAARKAQEANVKYAEQQMERTRKLYEAGVVSKQSLDEAVTAHDAAAAQLKALEATVQEQKEQLRYYRVTAPTSGIVGDIPVHVGDRVTNTTLLTTVDQPGALEAYVDIPVEHAHDIGLGKVVEILGPDGSVVAQSHVTFVSPQVNDATQTILIKSLVENKQDTLRNKQLVRARVIWGTRQALLIPVLAVSRINGQPFAFVAEGEDNKPLAAHQRQVQLGEMIGNNYVILEGIKPGERIIVGSTQMLGEGSPVQPKS
jgi:RND family efflux transporter MFP subunit